MKTVQDVQTALYTGQKIELSKPSKFALVFPVALLGFLAIFLTRSLYLGRGFELLIIAIFLVGIAFSVWKMMYAASAILQGKTLILHKVMADKKFVIDVNKITNVSTFQIKSARHITVTFKDKTGLEEKALIIQQNSFWTKQVTADVAIAVAQQMQ